MIATSVGELRRSDVDDALTGTGRNLMDEAHEVLIGIAEAHATTNTTLEERSRAREVEGDHALVLVPDVDHAVELVVARAYLIYIKEIIPEGAELSECLVNFLGSIEFGDEGMSLLLVDNLRCLEFFVLLVLDISQQEHKVLRFTRLQCDFDIMRSNRAPAVGMTIARLTLHHSLRISKFVIQANERFAVGIETLDGGIHVVEGVVVTTLTILGLVINRRTLNLYFTR